MRYKSTAVITRNRELLIVHSVTNSHWSLPGGKLESGETYRQALGREIKEELGTGVVSPKIYRKLTYYSREKKERTEMYVYRTKISGEPRPSGEIKETAWVNRTSICARELSTSLGLVFQSLVTDGIL